MLCDDNAQHLSNTTMVLQRQAHHAGQPITIEAFQNANGLLLAISNHEITAEIAILDIHMREIDGISLAKRINQVLPNCQIIFLTSYISYAMDVYEADHVYLVLKERQDERLWIAVEHAYNRYCSSINNTIVFHTSLGMKVVRFSEIRYFEHIGRKTGVYSTMELLWIKDSIDSIVASKLPKQFFKCHQGYIVNFDYVVSIDDGGYVLKDRTHIPISRARRKEAQQRFFDQMNAIVLHQDTSLS